MYHYHKCKLSFFLFGPFIWEFKKTLAITYHLLFDKRRILKILKCQINLPQHVFNFKGLAKCCSIVLFTGFPTEIKEKPQDSY